MGRDRHHDQKPAKRDRRERSDPIGRKLVQLLRHRVHENGLGSVLREDGYVPLDAVLRLQQFSGVTIETVREVVRTNDKQRMSLCKEGGVLYIRANQGHTATGINAEALLSPLDEMADQTALAHCCRCLRVAAACWPSGAARRCSPSSTRRSGSGRPATRH